jgi:HAD superfamily hydrolase (TIGR01549 family)
VNEQRDTRPVVLFDWGETLMWIPGMIHDPERHLACVEAIFDAEIRPELERAGASIERGAFIARYHEACRIQIARSRETQREHTFAGRFEMTFALAGVEARNAGPAFGRMAEALGHEVVKGAVLLAHAAETIEALARYCRLGVVSNYPQAPVVGATLERFGLRRHFSIVVVSSETGWTKPHPACYRPALDALPAPAARTLMVGDDLKNDIHGAKALGLATAWLAPKATELDPAVDIHLMSLDELPAQCERLFS